jgi:hypothetical protein
MMRRTSLSIALGIGSVTALALALSTSACTVVSGVDDMELRSSSSPVAPAAGDDTAAPAADAGAPDTSTGNQITTPATGPATCGSEGSWLGCVAPAAFTSCASICQNQGFTCVESCCATDELGDFAAKVGMVYALTAECKQPAITSQATFGLCTDALVLPAGFGDVRCCCK